MIREPCFGNDRSQPPFSVGKGGRAAACPFDLVKRQFHALTSNKLWDEPQAIDFTFVSIWAGVIYTAWVVDALQQVLDALWPSANLIHHADGTTYLVNIRYSERFAEATVDRSIGRVIDPCNETLAESVIGLFRIKVIHPFGPCNTNGHRLWLARDSQGNELMIHCGAEDSRHGISGRTSDGLFRHRTSSAGYCVKGC